MKLTWFGACSALLVVGAIATPTTVARAQGIDPRCPGGSVQNVVAQDACQKAIDIFAFMTPQLGIGLVGGVGQRMREEVAA